MQELKELFGWSSFSVTRAGKMMKGQLIHSRDDADTKTEQV